MSEDPKPTKPASPWGRRLRGLGVNLLILVLVFSAVQWWKSRPLAAGEAPELAGLELDGSRFDLRDLRGEPVLVHFWGTWCPVCRAMDGAIDSVAKDHRVISVALQSGGWMEVQQYMRKAEIAFPTITDPEGDIGARWGVVGVPASFIVDADGRIADATVGLSSSWGLRLRLWLFGRSG
ncbi:protein disulfide oxidoreductase [Imhoffiella purpurea]|uniref:Suppressor for copper-sensitivity D, putative n=1 Tax=Imhoffiella purpurea TaxID=1249627 RepID=W9VC34_9GAMM|nr:protein disulfide oxidoreductase [Imhoffiella purpurea]EXJ16994.1 suppressor for copper-sensitivity D, putative [Imhoffiella purpurea]